MAKRRYYKPGIKGGKFVISRYDDDGNTLPDIHIGSSGFSTTDSELQKILNEHPLRGHSAGFIEVTKQKEAKKKGLAQKGSASGEENDGQEKDDSDGKAGEKDSKDSEDENPAGSVQNINQAKDFLINNRGVDGRTLTSKEKILKTAKNLDPPVEFPKLN